MVHRRVRGGKFKVKKSPSPSPVEVGDELEVNIIEKAPSGHGVSVIRGYTIVVPKGKPGERVYVRITEVGKKTAAAEIIEP
ncbi:MAG TPA: TRAM domain-containing protein [Candidatus Acidoferrales bacterium]|nr:TRAM domain-containing protein [Candidatus Acidoferrales bacterium]